MDALQRCLDKIAESIAKKEYTFLFSAGKADTSEIMKVLPKLGFNVQKILCAGNEFLQIEYREKLDENQMEIYARVAMGDIIMNMITDAKQFGVNHILLFKEDEINLIKSNQVDIEKINFRVKYFIDEHVKGYCDQIKYCKISW